MNYSEMSDFEINELVAEACGLVNVRRAYADYWEDKNSVAHSIDYCNNPSDAWPIILENEISVIFDTGSIMASRSVAFDGPFCSTEGNVFDLNPLRAAMIVFLMMKEQGK